MRSLFRVLTLALSIYAATAGLNAFGQSSTGKATTAAPTYVNNTNAPLSLDLNGGLRVTCDSTCGGGGGSQIVDQGASGTDPWEINLTELLGTPLGATIPGAMDVTCVSGCVAGSGVSQGTATTAAPTYVDGTNNPLSLDLAGNLRVLVGNASLPVTQSGTWNIGTVTTITNPVAVTGTFWQTTQPVSGTFWQATQPVSGTFFQATQPVSIAAAVTANAATATTGGATPFHLIAANTNNSTLIGSAGAHTVYALQLTNNSANIAYAKLYDKATAPTCGTDTPIATLIIPGASSGGAGSNVTLGTGGVAVTLGLGLCVVTGIADSDNTAVAASAYAVNISYK